MRLGPKIVGHICLMVVKGLYRGVKNFKFPQKVFFASFWVKNEIFGEIWAFFEKIFQNLGHVNPLNTIRFWDFCDFSLRQRETLTAHIFGTTIAMDL